MFLNQLRISRYINLSKHKNRLFLSKLFSIFSRDEQNTDITIIGGGIIGYSTAFWLKKEMPKLNITVIERDNTYKQCSTVLSAGGIRQQFTIPENIQMSIFSGQVLSEIEKYFFIENNDKVDIQFVKRGYLILSDKDNANLLLENYNTQIKAGASLNFISSAEIKKNWPWMNTEDVECGVIGTCCQGWFDPWLLLDAVRKKVHGMGITFLNGELIEFKGQTGKLNGVKIRFSNGEEKTIQSTNFVNAAGSWASEICILAEQAVGLSGSDYPLYVRKCKRYIYAFHAPNFPRDSFTPMVIDFTEIYFRKDNSDTFVCGSSPKEDEEPSCDNLEVDYDWFNEKIWPKLYHRVPVMESLKVKSAWAGFYDYNTKDQNLIIGSHPVIGNLYLCNGSSGHGLQHALAIGRANMELILFGKFKTINLDRLSYKRFLSNELLFENNIF